MNFLVFVIAGVCIPLAIRKVTRPRRFEQTRLTKGKGKFEAFAYQPSASQAPPAQPALSAQPDEPEEVEPQDANVTARVDREALLELANLTYDEGKHAGLIQEGGIPALIYVLNKSTGSNLEIAACALANLAASPVCQHLIREEGGIRPLVRLVRAGTALAKQGASAALWKLARERTNEVPIREAGGIPPLVELLRQGDKFGKEHAAAALANLATDLENQDVIREAGGIKIMADTVRDGSPDAQHRILLCLRNLVKGEQNIEEMQQEGLLEAVVKVLRESKDEDTKGSAAALLVSLGARDAVKNAGGIVRTEGGIHALVQVLRSNSSQVQAEAARALVNLAMSPQNAAIVREEGGIRSLVKMLRAGSPEGKEKAAAVVRNMAVRPENHETVFYEGGEEALVEILKNKGNSKETRLHAYVALQGLYPDGGGPFSEVKFEQDVAGDPQVQLDLAELNLQHWSPFPLAIGMATGFCFAVVTHICPSSAMLLARTKEPLLLTSPW